MPKSVRVTPGDVVTAGETVGQVGKTGHASSPHLHLEIRKNIPANADERGDVEIEEPTAQDRTFALLATVDPLDYLDVMEQKLQLVHMSDDMLQRSVNTGFSGGEKKRNEILQMAVLDPKLAILDETDSGLDIDALRVVAEGVNAMRRADNATIVVTHYQRLLNHIVPDFVHVLAGGKIVRSGGKELALELEAKGYEGIGNRELGIGNRE